MYGEQLTMADALVITIFSMLLVFTALIVISYFIDMVAILANRKKQQVVETTPVALENETSTEVDDTELIAILAAAVAATSGKSLDSFTVRSVHVSGREVSPWNQVALRDLMR